MGRRLAPILRQFNGIALLSQEGARICSRRRSTRLCRVKHAAIALAHVDVTGLALFGIGRMQKTGLGSIQIEHQQWFRQPSNKALCNG